MTAAKPIIKTDLPAIREPIPAPPTTGNIDPASLLFKEDYAFVDTETTGIDPDADKIVEIAVVRFRGGKRETFHTLINPGFPIPPTASAVHGIVDEDVALAPRIEDIQAELIELLDGAHIVAHNSAFDANFVDPATGIDPAPKEWLCTYRLSRHLFENAPAHGNQVLRYWLKTKPESMNLGAHRAIDDVLVSIENFRHMLKVCQDRGMKSLPEVQAFANETIFIKTMPFGKYVDQKLEDIPADYFEWALREMSDLDEDLKVSMQREMARKATMPVEPVKSLPFGKHKDKTLDQVPTDYLEWVLGDTKNGGPKPAVAAGVRLELERRQGRAQVAQGDVPPHFDDVPLAHPADAAAAPQPAPELAAADPLAGAEQPRSLFARPRMR